jgi:hypothetical protein
MVSKFFLIVMQFLYIAGWELFMTGFDVDVQLFYICLAISECDQFVYFNNRLLPISPGPSFYYYGCYNCTDSTVQYLIHSIKAFTGYSNNPSYEPLYFASNGKLICFYEFANINKTNLNRIICFSVCLSDIFYLQSAIYVYHKKIVKLLF